MRYFRFALLFWIQILVVIFPAMVRSQDQSGTTESPFNNEAIFDARYDSITQLRSQGDPVAAMELLGPLLEELKVQQEAHPDDADGSLRLFYTLSLEANLLRDLNRNEESIEKQKRLLDMTADNQTLAVRLLHLEVRQNYALSLGQAGQRERAVDEIQQTLKGYEDLQELHPDDHQIAMQSTTASNNLGTQLILAGNHREAVGIFESAISLLRRFPEDGDSRDRKLSLLLLNNAMATATVGNPVMARQQIEEAIALKEKLGEGDSQEAIRARITLGAILGRLNQYHESAEAYRVVVEQLRELYPSDKYPNGTVDLAIAIDNRAVSLSRLKNFAEAVQLAEEANRMFSALAEQSPGLKLNLARSSATLSILNARLQRYQIAIENLSTAIKAYEEMFPGGHAELPGLYRSKAIMLSEMRRPEDAIEAAEIALNMARKQFPSNDYPDGHWVLAQTLDSTGLIYFAAERPEDAARYFSEAVTMQNQLAQQALRYISEAESLQFLAIADTFQSHLLSVPSNPAQTYQLLCNSKGRILDQQKSRFRKARESNDPQLAELYAQYEQVRRSLASLLIKPSNVETTQLLSRLQQSRETLERRLAETAEPKDANLKAVETNDDAQELSKTLESLDSESASVEFFSYEHFSINDDAEFRRTEGEQRICAFLIDPSSNSVKRLEFGEALAIRRNVRRLVAAMQYGTEQQPLDDLSKTICEPLLKHLRPEIEQLYIIPDDIISSVPFACLQDSVNDKLLVERFELSFLTSLDALQTRAPEINATMETIGVGAIDYGPIQDDQPIQYYQLPGTRIELDNLSQRIVPDRWTELSGASVTPDQLLAAVQSAELVHLATHAYVSNFARNAVTNNGLETGAIRDSATERSPLLATRMALSGANDPTKNAIVSGDQVISADLSRSKLVVLSACESGVGERVLGEGVFGLQRAFHVAGAENVIATLWPVSDLEAVVFMDAFYKALIDQKKTPAAALRQAQLDMLNSPPPRNDNQRMIVLRGIKFNIPDDSQPSDDASIARSDATQDGSARSTWGAFFLSVD